MSSFDERFDHVGVVVVEIVVIVFFSIDHLPGYSRSVWVYAIRHEPRYAFLNHLYQYLLEIIHILIFNDRQA
jgi:hypothetical protein